MPRSGMQRSGNGLVGYAHRPAKQGLAAACMAYRALAPTLAARLRSSQIAAKAAPLARHHQAGRRPGRAKRG